jgi:amidase
MADRALDLAHTRTGLDAVFGGPDGVKGTEDDFDAILFPQNRGAGAPAKAGYPSIVVPAGFTPPSGAVVNPAPFGVAFSGPAFSEPRLLALAYAFEQATKHRQPPASAPPLPTDLVVRR